MNALGDRLQALSRAESAREAPPHVEAALLRAWDAAHGEPRAAGIAWTRWAAVAAVAVGLSAVSAMWLQRPAIVDEDLRPGSRGEDVPLAVDAARSVEVTAPPVPVPRRTARARNTVAASVERPTSRTIVLVGPPVLAGERVRVVRMRVTRETLIEMGLRPIVQDDAASIDVEMLVGDDGVARGLRIRM